MEGLTGFPKRKRSRAKKGTMKYVAVAICFSDYFPNRIDFVFG